MEGSHNTWLTLVVVLTMHILVVHSLEPIQVRGISSSVEAEVFLLHQKYLLMKFLEEIGHFLTIGVFFFFGRWG